MKRNYNDHENFGIGIFYKQMCNKNTTVVFNALFVNNPICM